MEPTEGSMLVLAFTVTPSVHMTFVDITEHELETWNGAISLCSSQAAGLLVVHCFGHDRRAHPVAFEGHSVDNRSLLHLFRLRVQLLEHLPA